MTHLLLATRNAHKTREFAEILGADYVVEDLHVHPEIGEIVEDGATFEENARIKAVAVSRQLPGLVLADDSGLEVDSLGGAPGIYSARYAGAEANDAANRRKLLTALAKLPLEMPRTGRFRCVLALARDGEVIVTFDGALAGKIVGEERGENGFGYDALFQPNERGTTLAELSAGEKNAISHRAVAVAKLSGFLSQRDTKSRPV